MFTVPTADDIRAFYPQFAAVLDAPIDMALMEAGLYVDDCWGDVVGGGEAGQKRFTLAYSLYTAHVLTVEGHGTSTEAQLALSGLSGFDTIRSGDLSVSRSSRSGDDGFIDPLTQTIFGRRFIALRDALFCGPRVIDINAH